MVKQARVDLDAVFAALAHPIRRAMVERLAEGDCTVGELASAHDVTAPAISKHLRVLEDAGLLEQTPDGRVRRCALKGAPLSAAFGWLVQYRLFWEDALDALARHLEAPGPPPASGRPPAATPASTRSASPRSASPRSPSPRKPRT